MARTIDRDVPGARATLDDLAQLGVDLATIVADLEAAGVASFEASFDDLLGTLQKRIEGLRG